MVRELPIFSRDPKKWILFASEFRRSTKNCRFSNDEILVRIPKCLRSKTRDTI